MKPSHPDWLLITPLHHFAGKGDRENTALFIDRGAVELFLARGAKPNLPDDPHWATPIAWATRRAHRALVDMLKEHGAR